MRRYLGLGLAAATACAVFAAYALAANTSTVEGTFSPSTIPTGKFKGGKLEVHLTTLDSTDPGTSTAPTIQPVPTTRVKAYLDGAFRVTTTGLPTCTEAQLTGTTTPQAEAACGPGSGNNAEVTLTNAGVSSPGSARLCVGGGAGTACGAVAAGVVTAYNGPPTSSGQPVLFLHIRWGLLNGTTIIGGPLRAVARNGFRKVLDATVPLIAGGDASITDLDVTLRRKYTDGALNRNYLKATCDDGTWDFQADFTYADTSTSTATDSQACTAS